MCTFGAVRRRTPLEVVVPGLAHRVGELGPSTDRFRGPPGGGRPDAPFDRDGGERIEELRRRRPVGNVDVECRALFRQ